MRSDVTSARRRVIPGLVLGGVLLATAALSGSTSATAGPVAAGPAAARPLAAGPAAARPAPAAADAAAASADARLPYPGGIPDRNEAFLLQAVNRLEDPVLTVTADNGRIGTYPGGADTGEREQFVLIPLSPGDTTYFLRTAKLRVAGEPQCVGVDADAGVLRAMFCDAREQSQHVRLAPPNGRDGKIKKRFDLIVGGYNVEVSRLGKVSLDERDAPATTTFRFIPAGRVGDWP